jgi:hypothetical protein
MSIWLIRGVCLLLSASPGAACTSINSSEAVEVLTAQPAARKVQIKVALDGAPVPGAKLAVYSADERLLLRASADDSGIVHLQKMSPGQYHIVATGEGHLRSDIVLAVSKKAGVVASVFQMDLLLKPERPRSDEYSLLAEELPVRERVPELRGRIEDPLGAAIVGATLKVYEDGAGSNSKPVEFKAGDDGSFSHKFSDGIYRGLVMFPGFRTSVVVFEISRFATNKNLHVPLQIGGCS